MAEYIEREAAYPLAKKICDAVDSQPRVLLPRTILDLIDDLPAADVRPVVKGKWKKVGTQMHLNLDNAREQYRELGYPHRNIECLQCSNCRKVSMVDESIRYEFCPHCGADMRET